LVIGIFAFALNAMPFARGVVRLAVNIRSSLRLAPTAVFLSRWVTPNLPVEVETQVLERFPVSGRLDPPVVKCHQAVALPGGILKNVTRTSLALGRDEVDGALIFSHRTRHRRPSRRIVGYLKPPD
jgi:hypothetical protein